MNTISHQLEDTVEQESKLKPKLPKNYKVILLNDDYTPMEFVVDVIQKVFRKTHDEATKIMLQIHTEGIGICGIYPLEIAETKMNQVLNLSKESQHPLQCIIEKI
ncbi:MAG: ATP-dependent Clp protease adapter ClpS [Nitrosomonadales bacterium]|jgi:ATP-dependent Clp protease adaptor protein ClpS|nr:ATP-dependent Clp protease adapter ClpS [Nitrosomonadales bacterium]MBT6232386.1 ATP-dependent Clp protease adapter ClpS [Nitrosomonadales bacterium]MCH9771290.1 ATP-dependent Clp protease adapter ClpS [Betaproteobacteria bacterium]